MWSRCLLLSMVLLSATLGCGKPPMLTVQGTVQLDGQPVANCKVGFFPDVELFDPDRYGYGYGITDKDGKYVIQHPGGETGIWPGKYKVTFVAWVNQSGKPLSVDTKPSEVEGGVKNRFPDIYEAPSSTPEKVVVSSDAKPQTFDFNVVTKNKK